MEKSHSESYRAAGVDITAGYEAVRRMAAHVERTRTPGVMAGLGGFGGLFAPDLTGIKEPVLVSGTDGVGTKLRLAFLMDKHDTVGIDCVAMCVNDIVCAGATPLFFLDYIACGKNVPERIEAIVAGVAEGCVQAGCALVGGETAEMPGFYKEDEYDLAGFSVGLADKARLMDNRAMKAGDVLLAFPSSGVHSNGFSLVRRVFRLDEDPAALGEYTGTLGRPLGEVLLAPTRIYVKPALALMAEVPVLGFSHITGGGFFENIPRCMPEGLSVQIDLTALKTPPIFTLIQEVGHIPQRDMFNTFNMGVGLCAIVPEERAQRALQTLRDAGEAAYVLGHVVPGDAGVLL
ncbi:MAG: phosphoribosylformylglycinamidine cyclo-ligase [Oscillospiraceae bacterium]